MHLAFSSAPALQFHYFHGIIKNLFNIYSEVRKWRTATRHIFPAFIYNFANHTKIAPERNKECCATHGHKYPFPILSLEITDCIYII